MVRTGAKVKARKANRNSNGSPKNSKQSSKKPMSERPLSEQKARIDAYERMGLSWDPGAAYRDGNGTDPTKYKNTKSKLRPSGKWENPISLEAQAEQYERYVEVTKRDADGEPYSDAFLEQIMQERQLSDDYGEVEKKLKDKKFDLSIFGDTTVDMQTPILGPKKKISKKKLKQMYKEVDRLESILDEIVGNPGHTTSKDYHHELIHELQNIWAGLADHPYIREYRKLVRTVEENVARLDIQKSGKTVETFFRTLDLMGQNFFDTFVYGKYIASRWSEKNMKQLEKGDKTMLFFHGFYQNSGAFREAMKEAARQGYVPIAVDWDYKSGNAAGARTIGKAITEVYKRTGTKVDVYGHSSGSDALRYALLNPKVNQYCDVKILSEGSPNLEEGQDGILMKAMGKLPDEDFATTGVGRRKAIKFNDYVGNRTIAIIGGGNTGMSDGLLSVKGAYDRLANLTAYYVGGTHFDFAGGNVDAMRDAIGLARMFPTQKENGTQKSNSYIYRHMQARPAVLDTPVLSRYNIREESSNFGPH